MSYAGKIRVSPKLKIVIFTAKFLALATLHLQMQPKFFGRLLADFEYFGDFGGFMVGKNSAGFCRSVNLLE